jgi:hypothetical protein
LAVVDENGNNVSSAVKAAVAADLAARREQNWLVYVTDPTTNLINVTYNIRVLPGYDSVAVLAAVNAALSSYLSRATWGATPTVNDWVNIPNVRYLEVAQVINAVVGVDYITTTGGNYDLQIAIQGNALARADLVLTGIAPLPQANTLTGTAI